MDAGFEMLVIIGVSEGIGLCGIGSGWGGGDGTNCCARALVRGCTDDNNNKAYT